MLNISTKFNGRVYYRYLEREGVLDGEKDFEVGVASTILGSKEQIKFIAIAPAIMIIPTMVNPPDCSQPDQKLPGVAMKLSYNLQSGSQFFLRLLTITDDNIDCDVDAFMNLDGSRDLHAFSFRSECLQLTLGRLMFPKMIQIFYFFGSYSTELFCLQSSLVHEVSNPSLFINAMLAEGSLGRLGTFLEIKNSNSCALSVVFDQQSNSVVGQLQQVSISILGTSFDSTVEICNNELDFAANALIYGQYGANLMVSAPLNVTASWDRVPFTVKGILDEEFARNIEDRVYMELEAIGNEADQRLQTATNALNEAEQQLQTAETRFSNSRDTLRDANVSHAAALQRVEIALSRVAAAEDAFTSASTQLQQFQDEINMLCTERICEDECRPGQTIETQQMTIQNTRFCPQNDEVVIPRRVPQFFETRQTWVWMLECRNVLQDSVRFCNTFCMPQQNEECYGVSVPVSEVLPVYNWKNVTIKFSSCQAETITEIVTITMVVRDECAVMAPNETCVLDNVACRRTRQTAFDNLDQARQDIAVPFMVLDEARNELSTARTDASLEEIRLENSRQAFEQARIALDRARVAKELAEENVLHTSSQLEQDLEIRDLINSHGRNIVNMIDVSFNVRFIRNPTQLPLGISYSTPNSTIERVSVTVNFLSPPTSVYASISERIINNTFGSAPRTTRSIRSQQRMKRQNDQQEMETEEEDENVQRFQQNCADLQNIAAFFGEIATSILEANETLAITREDAMAIVNGSSLENFIESLDPLSSINITALESVFNVTADADALKEGTINSPEVNASINLLRNYQELALQILADYESNAFSDWKNGLDQLYNSFASVSGYPCFSLTDCLLTATNILEHLLLNTPGVEAAEQLGQLKLAMVGLLNLESSNLTVPEAANRIFTIVEIIDKYSAEPYWCSSTPNITIHPPLEVNISVNSDLQLFCEAVSDLPIKYQWTRDGNVIPGATNKQLIIPNIQRLDSGNYSCLVSSDIGTVESIISSVTVYILPQFYLVLVPTTVREGADNGALLTCNATAFPFPGWRWYFRRTLDEPWTLIEGEDTNELLIPSPQSENEGWYTCEAFNWHGSIRAGQAFLRVLPVSVSQQAIPVEFLITAEELDKVDSCQSSTELESSVFSVLLNVVRPNVLLDLRLMHVSDSTYRVSFLVASTNVTSEDTRRSTLFDIANTALPTRITLEERSEALEEELKGGRLTISCGLATYTIVDGSLQFQTVTFLCPPGQQLRADYLLCESCKPGSFPVYSEVTTLFGAEALTEVVPQCRPCSVGFFQPHIGGSECMSCPLFYTTLSTGSTAKDECFVDPLQISCSTENSTVVVEIDCRTNRAVERTLCSFDGGLLHPCTLSILVTRKALSAGEHTIAVAVSDVIGFSASDTVEFTSGQLIGVLPMLPPLEIHFQNDSPRIVGEDSIEVDFILSRPATSVTCKLSRQPKQDCSSGSAVFSELAPGRYTLRVEAKNRDEPAAIERRKLELSSDPQFCSLHLINDGVTVEEGGARVWVEFVGDGPAVDFICFVDKQPSFKCTSPVELSDLAEGEHNIKIVPNGCGRRRRPMNIPFVV